MVNYGRRVGACSLCKARKVKCDETKPQCLRCQKYGRECPGVPDTKPTTLRWRYKMADPEEARRSQSMPVASAAAAAAADELPAAVKERAIAAYFDAFVENNFFMSYVTPLYHNCQDPSPLAHIIAACAISAYSRIEGDQHLYGLYALREYHDALRALRENLESPDSVKQNETIAAVLLLISWESQSGQIDHQKAVESQVGHLLGVMTLLRNRGPSQFNYPISLRLFRGTRNHIFMSLAYRPTGLHLLYAPGFDWFGERGLQEDLETEQQSQLVEAAWNTPLLRHHAAELFKSNTNGSSATIRMAEDLLQHAESTWERLQKWRSQTPPEWAPTPVPHATSPVDLNDITQAHAWPGSITIYPSLIVAFMHDNYNALRVLVAAAALQIMGWMRTVQVEFTAEMIADEYKWQYRHQEAVDDICASIPFQTGQYPPDFEVPDPRPPIHAEPKTRDFLGSYLAYFPMAVALRQPYVPPEQRAWLREQIEAIEQVNGCGLSCNLYYDGQRAETSDSVPGSSSNATPTTPTALMSELVVQPGDAAIMSLDPALDQ